MARPCSVCTHPERDEIDKLLIRGEPYRTIAKQFRISESAVFRHKASHIAADLRDVREVMVAAREEALAQIKTEELETLADVKEEIITEAKGGISARLEACRDYFGQLKVLRERAALALETAEGAEDIKTALQAIKELREMVRLWAELEGRIASQPQITLITSPEWVEVRSLVINALEPYPEAREAVVHAIRGR